MASMCFILADIPAFPNDLASCLCSSIEIEEFTKACKNIGVRYIGLCCGNASNKLRIVAETYGRTPPASQFSPDLSQNSYYLNLKVSYTQSIAQS